MGSSRLVHRFRINNAIKERSADLVSKATPGHRFPVTIATHCPRPRVWGATGHRAGASHSPSAPPPMAINDRRHGGSSSTEGAQATTVHCMRTCPRKKGCPRDSLVRRQPHKGKDGDRNIGFQQSPFSGKMSPLLQFFVPAPRCRRRSASPGAGNFYPAFFIQSI
jgi:hypothetical protein